MISGTVSVRTLAALLALLLTASGLSAAQAQEPPAPAPMWSGATPSTPGAHLAVWAGGTLEQAAATPGAVSIWVTSAGAFEGYVVGAPDFVNAAIRARFADGHLPAGTPALVVIRAEVVASAPADVVRAFLDALEEAAPPVSSEAAFVRALSALTDDARSRATSPGHLAGFIGVQDLPDLWVVLDVREQTAVSSSIHAVLRYTGGEAEREFVLARAGSGWLIDWVDAAPIGAASSPDEVVSAFLRHSFAAAPPHGRSAPAVRAASLLTASARELLAPSLPLASALAGFIGIQDVPDEGFETTTLTAGETTATVRATLRYSGGATARTFVLHREEAGWRIRATSP